MRVQAILFGALLLSIPALAQDSEAVLARRRQSLEELLKVLPPTRDDPAITGGCRISAIDKSWEDLIKRTGLLPPDFDSMPSIPELPDPLVIVENGRRIPITNLALWNRQKKWIRSQFEYWVFGKMPPPPDNLRAVVTSEHRERTSTIRDVRLEFGPEHRASLRLQLIIPDGKGPFPVFLTNHARNRPEVYPAVRRGYMACIYFATDPKYGNGDDSDKFIEIYPEYDFSGLARWAWSASRAVDYLYTLPEVDRNKIGLTGLSRNGKQALIAAAFDERITAVIPVSGNTGECNPWRFVSAIFPSESMASITASQPGWFHPRLRFFVGREHKLPVDQNMLMALVAPRGLMMYSAYSEQAGNPVGFEQAYRSVRRVYRFLGHEQNVWLHLRPGEHDTTDADVENFIDFFDTIFGRKKHPKSETWIHGYTFDNWQAISRERLDPLSYPRHVSGDILHVQADGKLVDSADKWERKKKELRQAISWALGEEPPGIPFLVYRRPPTLLLSSDDLMLSRLFGRPFKATSMGFAEVPFGDGLKGDLYYPLGPDGKARPGKWPVVVWLHAYAYSQGYSRFTQPMFDSLTERGFAVFAFDQIGFGTRVLDARQFYDRYPKWSLMGKMVTDTRAAVEALAAFEHIDASRIYLLGYALGAKVGLLTAALDDHVTALAAVCGFRPLRLDTPAKGTEGIHQYSHLHGLIPRFGFFIGQENRLPIDDDEILAMIAPRPVRIVAPTLDRYNPPGDVRLGVENARKVYALLGYPGALVLALPLDFDEFSRDTPERIKTQERTFEWLSDSNPLPTNSGKVMTQSSATKRRFEIDGRRF